MGVTAICGINWGNEGKGRMVDSKDLDNALSVLKQQKNEDNTWHVEKRAGNLITKINFDLLNECITKRANEVLNYYSK